MNTVLLISLYATFINLVVVGLFWRQYRIHRIPGFALLVLGFGGMALVNLSYAILTIPTIFGSEFLIELLFDVFVIMGIGWGPFISILGYRLLTESPMPKRYIIYLLFAILFIPIVMFVTESLVWQNDQWRIVYEPSWTNGIIAGFVIIFSLEITGSIYNLTRDSIDPKVRYYLYVLIATLITSMSSYYIREQLGIVNFHLIGSSIYFLAIGLMITNNTEVFLTSSIPPEFLFVLESRSGIPIKFYNFKGIDISQGNEMLLASAFTAIQSVFSETSTYFADIESIKFQGIHLLVGKNEKIQFILAANERSYSLKSKVKQLSNLVDMDDLKSHEDDDFLTSMIRSVFIHQLARLDLLLQEKSVEEIMQEYHG